MKRLSTIFVATLCFKSLLGADAKEMEIPKSVSDMISGEILAPEEMLQSSDFGKLTEKLETTVTKALAGDASASYALYKYYTFQLNDKITATVWLAMAADAANHDAQFCLARHYWNQAKKSEEPNRSIYLMEAKYWAAKPNPIDPNLVDEINRAMISK